MHDLTRNHEQLDTLFTKVGLLLSVVGGFTSIASMLTVGLRFRRTTQSSTSSS